MQEPKSSNFYMQKSWCDAKDGLGVWRVGRIKKRQKDLITIHFDGWSDKWKQIYCLHSDLIAPFRMHSKGYTGQSKLALREWDYNEDNLKVHEGKMKMMTHNEFSGFIPRDLTNFLRGDLFIQVDCLLSFTYTNPSRDVPRVCEFFGMVLDLIIKWLQLAPSKFEAANKKEPDAYLYERPAAIYKSGYELLETLTSILGLNQRTSKFYDKYKALTSAKPLIQSFMSKQGITHLKNILDSKLPLEDFWPLFSVIPNLFSTATTSANRYIPDLSESLINSLENITDEGMMNITDDYWKLELFVESFDTMMRLVLPDNQREQNVAAFRSKFRLDRQSLLLQTYSEPILDLDKVFKKTIPEPSVIITSPISFQAKDATPKPPIKSPVSNSQVNPTTPRPLASDQTPTVTSTFSRYSAHVPGVQHSIQSPSPQVTGNFSSAVFETLQSQISNLQNLVELKHQECVGLIEKSLKSKLEKHQDNDYKLEEVFKEHNSCDHQEFAILSSMEYLLTENKAEDALRLLRWRKKILKLANMNGWEIAEDVARRTLQKLEVTSSDIIDSNFRSMMGKNSVNSR